MIPLPVLWLPILLSAVFVFIASNILWQALPFWHRSDYGQINSIADSIWYGKPWAVTLKVIVDGIIYGLRTAGTFGWLWPR